MSLLQETIAYLWLLPVVAQIVLPIGMLLIYLIKKLLSIKFSENMPVVSIAGTELKTSGVGA